jgi:hypothetical protein
LLKKRWSLITPVPLSYSRPFPKVHIEMHWK